jgi:hypothetical protein
VRNSTPTFSVRFCFEQAAIVQENAFEIFETFVLFIE